MKHASWSKRAERVILKLTTTGGESCQHYWTGTFWSTRTVSVSQCAFSSKTIRWWPECWKANSPSCVNPHGMLRCRQLYEQTARRRDWKWFRRKGEWRRHEKNIENTWILKIKKYFWKITLKRTSVVPFTWSDYKHWTWHPRTGDPGDRGLKDPGDWRPKDLVSPWNGDPPIWGPRPPYS